MEQYVAVLEVQYPLQDLQGGPYALQPSLTIGRVSAFQYCFSQGRPIKCQSRTRKQESPMNSTEPNYEMDCYCGKGEGRASLTLDVFQTQPLL